MNPIVRRVIILGTPLALCILTFFHPGVSTGAFEDLGPQVDWWITLHLLQLVLFCLLGLSAYLLLDGIQSTAATCSRVALAVFVIFYPAADTILGISTGILIRNSTGLPDFPRAVAAQTINTFFSGDPLANVIAALGGFGWGIGLLLAAVALLRPSPVLSRLQWSGWLVIVPALLVGLAIEDVRARSEEHTSELQSHLNLVCRLLLEKKKNSHIASVLSSEISSRR